MKNTIYIAFVLLFLLLVSCEKADLISIEKESSILNQSIGGIATIDLDMDGISESPMEGARIYFGNSILIEEIVPARPDTLDFPYNEILWADVNENGNYVIKGVPVAENQSLVLSYDQPLLFLNGKDNTPDGDMLEEQWLTSINCTIEEGEYDDGNDFMARLKIIDGLIAGNVQIDRNIDGILDGPEEGVKLWLSKRNSQGNSAGAIIETTYTDVLGNYAFGAIDDGRYVVTFASNLDYEVTSSADASVDSDPLGENISKIPVDITIEEEDTDNNFEIIPKWYSVTGFVKSDNNEDGIGDEGLYQQELKLYQRDNNGNPTGSLIATKFTTQIGFYDFKYIDPGNYVILLVADDDYECVTSGDKTPEINEPTASILCNQIPTDVLSQDSEDYDNDFVLKKL